MVECGKIKIKTGAIKMTKKSIVQTGSTEYLQDLGLVFQSHKEPDSNEIKVFVREDGEFTKEPNPFKGNVLKMFSFSSEDKTIDEALDEVISSYRSK
jgi:ABC-type cobalamin/Fe3+-siderophores transport system ATPase subunit